MIDTELKIGPDCDQTLYEHLKVILNIQIIFLKEKVHSLDGEVLALDDHWSLNYPAWQRFLCISVKIKKRFLFLVSPEGKIQRNLC